MKRTTASETLVCIYLKHTVDLIVLVPLCFGCWALGTRLQGTSMHFVLTILLDLFFTHLFILYKDFYLTVFL